MINKLKRIIDVMNKGINSFLLVQHALQLYCSGSAFGSHKPNLDVTHTYINHIYIYIAPSIALWCVPDLVLHLVPSHLTVLNIALVHVFLFQFL